MATQSMPHLVNGWLELESDPGLFTLLVERMGVRGVQVEEIYDLSRQPLIDEEDDTLGFIFLFKWSCVEERSRRVRCRQRQIAARQFEDEQQQNLKRSDARSDCSQSDSLLGHSECSNLTSSSLDTDEQYSASKRNEAEIYEKIGGKAVSDCEEMNKLFFAQQIVPNSCATHALISILMNLQASSRSTFAVDIGDNLRSLLAFTQQMSPENRGLALGNCGWLARTHNAHATALYNRLRIESKLTLKSGDVVYNGDSSNDDWNSLVVSSSAFASSSRDTFHFVSYVPMHGRLYEMDGLKRWPIDHGPILDGEKWTNKFSRVIQQRLDFECGGDQREIRIALMAVIPDRRAYIRSKLDAVRAEWEESLRSLSGHIADKVDTFLESECEANPEFSADIYDQDDVPEVKEVPSDPNQDGICSNLAMLSEEYNQLAEALDQVLRYSEHSLALRSRRSGIHSTSESSPTADGPFNLERNPFFTDRLLDTHDYSLPPWMEHNSLLARDWVIDTWLMEQRTKLAHVADMERHMTELSRHLDDEESKRQSHAIDHSRRTHDYTPFVEGFLSAMSQHGLLTDAVELCLKDTSASDQSGSRSKKKKKSGVEQAKRSTPQSASGSGDRKKRKRRIRSRWSSSSRSGGRSRRRRSQSANRLESTRCPSDNTDTTGSATATVESQPTASTAAVTKEKISDFNSNNSHGPKTGQPG